MTKKYANLKIAYKKEGPSQMVIEAILLFSKQYEPQHTQLYSPVFFLSN